MPSSSCSPPIWILHRLVWLTPLLSHFVRPPPGCTRGGSRQADRGAGPDRSVVGSRRPGHTVGAARSCGAGGPDCSDRCTLPAPSRGAGGRRSACGPTPLGRTMPIQVTAIMIRVEDLAGSKKSYGDSALLA